MINTRKIIALSIVSLSLISPIFAGQKLSSPRKKQPANYYLQTLHVLQQQYRYLAEKIENYYQENVQITPEDLELAIQYIRTCDFIRCHYNDVPLVVLALHIINELTAQKFPDAGALAFFNTHSCSHPLAQEARYLLEQEKQKRCITTTLA